MRKTNKSYTLSLCVDYALIDTTDKSADPLFFADDDIYATEWMHQQGYKARIEGNTLVLCKDYGWGKVESRYLILPRVDFHDYRENRNYSAINAVCKRLAMAHTIAIIRKVNGGR